MGAKMKKLAVGMGDVDQRELGLAGGDEEVGVLDAEQRHADEGEVAEQRDPGGPGHRRDLVDPLDLGLGLGGHGGISLGSGRNAAEGSMRRGGNHGRGGGCGVA